ncbi:AraC family transcriptional regulator [Herbihabitans rhizosphaerae]|uniref:AraC family transcriptional regulator n=1 Tax=Herbihabitans rhizosphaerae TaxID=1872711 RepID=A0A4Q7KF77_9PSEU|nr:AraC family transcriptional regulator [Herbihabitans rhizosphaerae]RZS32522.1 AraC family transcriptional regulator [Herbihabitans rhizosphaerae]
MTSISYQLAEQSVAPFTTADGHRTWTHLPDAATTVVFRTTAGGRGDLLVVGPRTRASYHPDKDVPLCVKIRVRPGWASELLGRPVGGLTDQVVPIERLWHEDGARLTAELTELAVGGPAAAATIRRTLEDALAERLTEASPRHRDHGRLVRTAIAGLSQGPRPLSVHDLARRLRISERQLRNVFTSAVGVSPKRFAAIDRVRTVLAGAGRDELAGLAAAAGYYDQSHMTAEFRATMGVPPARFIAGRLPTPVACSA